MTTRKGHSRNRWTLFAAIPGLVVATICFALAGWWAFMKGHPKWDDYFMLGVAWLLVAAGSAALLRTGWCVVSPERWLPRWLAISLIVAAGCVAGAVALFVFYANSFGP